MDDEKPSDQKDEKKSEKSQDEKTENAIPYARFKEVNDKAKELEAKLKERDEAEKKVREKELLDQKKFEELLKTRDAELEKERAEKTQFAQKAQAFEEEQTKLRENALSKIKDDKLKGIAMELSTPKLLQFVEEIESQKVGVFGGKVPRGGEPDSPVKPKAGEDFHAWDRRLSEKEGSKNLNIKLPEKAIQRVRNANPEKKQE